MNIAQYSECRDEFIKQFHSEVLLQSMVPRTTAFIRGLGIDIFCNFQGNSFSARTAMFNHLWIALPEAVIIAAEGHMSTSAAMAAIALHEAGHVLDRDELGAWKVGVKIWEQMEEPECTGDEIVRAARVALGSLGLV